MRVTEADLARFLERLRRRLEVGEAVYASSSFRRPAGDLLSEVEEELLDVCGWSLLVLIRLERIRERVDRIDTGGSDVQP